MSLTIVIGLGARLLLQKIFPQPQDYGGDAWSTYSNRVLAGVWQGAFAHFMSASQPRLAFAVLVGLAGRVAFALLQLFLDNAEPQGLAATLLGIAFGVLFAEIADTVYMRLVPESERRVRKSSKRRHTSNGASSGESHPRPAVSHAVPADATPPSGTNSEHINALELEIAELQGEAASASAQRRRFEEERKWALEQGNFAWASQLAWQIQRCDALERSYAASARTKMRELEDQNHAVHVDVYGHSYLDDILVNIEDRLRDARLHGKQRLRIALSGPRDQVENEVKPVVKEHFMRHKRRVVQDPIDPAIIYINVDPSDDSSTTTGAAKSDEWSRALD